jgi:hypothetical protein
MCGDGRGGKARKIKMLKKLGFCYLFVVKGQN